MGFTHYFRRPRVLPRRLFAAAAADCRAVLDRLARDPGLVVQRDLEDQAPPVLTPDLVQFNGVGHAGHETFFVPRVFEPYAGQEAEQGLWFAFCKTARKPYDLAVCSCLIVLRHHFGERFLVASDAEESTDPDRNDPENWPVARSVCQRVLGYGDDFRLPADDEFGRIGRNGIPYRPSPYGNERGVYHLANGWGMVSRRNADGRNRRVGVYTATIPSRMTPDSLVCEAATLAAAQFRATVEWLRHKFAGAEDLEAFLGGILESGDLSRLAVYADRLADAGDSRESLLRSLLPRRWAGAATR